MTFRIIDASPENNTKLMKGHSTFQRELENQRMIGLLIKLSR